jgi:hypothetical protein
MLGTPLWASLLFRPGDGRAARAGPAFTVSELLVYPPSTKVLSQTTSGGASLNLESVMDGRLC